MGQQISHPSSENAESEYQRFRNLADKEAQKRNDCYSQSQEAYKNGQGLRAKELSLKGKEHEKKMQEYNDKAAEIIFFENNKKRLITELDLHGLHVKEAVKKTELRLKQCKSKGFNHLVIIVGVGRHSTDGISKLRPAILKLVKEYNLRCTPNKPTVGCLYVEIGSGVGEDLGWFQSLFSSIVNKEKNPENGSGCIIC